MPEECITAIRHGTDNYTVSKNALLYGGRPFYETGSSFISAAD